MHIYICIYTYTYQFECSLLSRCKGMHTTKGIHLFFVSQPLLWVREVALRGGHAWMCVCECVCVCANACGENTKLFFMIFYLKAKKKRSKIRQKSTKIYPKPTKIDPEPPEPPRRRPGSVFLITLVRFSKVSLSSGRVWAPFGSPKRSQKRAKSNSKTI